MTTKIHPSACVDPGAELGDEVEIGPSAVIGEHVRIGRGTVVAERASIVGWTTVGEGCRIFQGACLGTPPQDLKYTPCRSYVIVGDHSQIREYVTIHPGTGPEEATRIGDHCLLMAYSHVAHNCELGDHVIMANSANLAGHIVLESHVSIGGLVGVHQFCRVGYGAFIGGCCLIRQDIVPFVLAAGTPCRPHGINVIGLRRRGYTSEQIQLLERAYRILFHRGLTEADARRRLAEEFPESEEVRKMVEFIGKSNRGLSRPKGGEKD